MASEKLIEKIDEMAKQLRALRKLAKNPPVLPDGWKLAQVTSIDLTALKYESSIPPEGSWTVVPHNFPDSLNIMGCREGNIVQYLDSSDKWNVVTWGETQEEAIVSFLSL